MPQITKSLYPYYWSFSEQLCVFLSYCVVSKKKWVISRAWSLAILQCCLADQLPSKASKTGIAQCFQDQWPIAPAHGMRRVTKPLLGPPGKYYGIAFLIFFKIFVTLLTITGFISNNDWHKEKRSLQVLPIFHFSPHKSTAVEEDAFSHQECCAVGMLLLLQVGATSALSTVSIN